MNFTVFVATLLAFVSAANADGSQNAAQLAASQEDQVDVGLATPAPTTFNDLPTPAPTNFNGLPTPAPTFPTAAPTQSADLVVTPAPTSSDNVTQTDESSTGVVGVAYSSTGTVGVAYATTRTEYEASTAASASEGSSYTVPVVVVGCLVGVLGAVAAVVMKKRKAADLEIETDYSNAIHTPAV